MTAFIIKRYLLSDSPGGRCKAAVILSIVGILLNLLLFLIKTIGGELSGSVAITADGFNNLADTCSCVLTLLGFVLGSKKPNDKYPMGYGRLEYLSGLMISAVILFIGGEMFVSSFGKILHPEPIDGSFTVIAILLISIMVKGYMYRYNSRIGRMIHSAGMKAAAMDSLSDCFATLAILTAVLIEKLTGFNADGFTGVLVAVCILYAGLTSAKECVEPLLGKGMDDKTLQKLNKVLGSHRDISVSHLLLHDYGPKKKLLTFYLSAENPSKLIPILKKEIEDRFGIEAVISPVEAAERKNPDEKNKASRDCQKYCQTKQTQEREASEHQTR